jgi:hypothetical protein
MNRTVWLAAFCLSVIGGLCASRVTASISPREASVPAQIAVGVIVDPASLARADKADARLDLPAEEITSALPDNPTAVPQITPRSTGTARRPSNPNANRKTVILPKPRPKIRLAKTGNARTAINVKNCSRPDSVAGDPDVVCPLH